MKKNRVYLDNCCFNRPFDEQIYEIIKLETEAKLYIQEKIRIGKIELAWSFILDFENSVNPYEEKKASIFLWKHIANINIQASETIRLNALRLKKITGIKPKDALHLSCAIEAECKFFLTTDKLLIKKSCSLNEIKVINPVDFILMEEK
jgi:hypothetical protein